MSPVHCGCLPLLGTQTFLPSQIPPTVPSWLWTWGPINLWEIFLKFEWDCMKHLALIQLSLDAIDWSACLAGQWGSIHVTWYFHLALCMHSATDIDIPSGNFLLNNYKQALSVQWNLGQELQLFKACTRFSDEDFLCWHQGFICQGYGKGSCYWVSILIYISYTNSFSAQGQVQQS